MKRTLSDIVAASRPIPFSENEVRAATDAVKMRRSKGTDLVIGHPKFIESAEAFLGATQEGLMLLHSPHQLESAFLFVKLDAGRGLLGGQKAVFASYIASDLDADAWAPGAVFKMWAMAVTSIGNLYRHEGFQ